MDDINIINLFNDHVIFNITNNIKRRSDYMLYLFII